MKYQEFFLYLEMNLLNEKSNGCFKKIDTKYNMPIVLESSNNSKHDLPETFYEVYQKTNGMIITWEANFDNINVYGRTNFLKYDEVIRSWKGELYELEDLEKNDFLEFFHPFDLITDEAQCGFMITPEETYKSIFYNQSGYAETLRLELDFKGYVTMLYNSNGYHNWPLAILHIINNDESEWLSEFKKNMTQLFSDFKWINYVETFNSIRLDKTGS